MHDLVLKNGTIVTPEGVIQGGVAISDGRIAAVGVDPGMGHQEIDLAGRTVLPGLIDPHVHFGFGDEIDDETMAEDFEKNSKDSLVGGVTTIATTTTLRPGTLPELFDAALKAGSGQSYCDFKLTSVVNSAEQVSQIPQVIDRGGVSFKFFTGYVGAQAEAMGIDPRGITPDLFYRANELLAASKVPTFAAIHAEDPYVRGILVDRVRQETGSAESLVAWAESSPEFAESLQIYTFGLISNGLGVPIYPVHISAAQSVDTIHGMRKSGIDITAETLTFYLNTTADEMDAHGMGSKAKVQPPVRYQRDQDRLWKGIQDGDLTIVATDSCTYSSRGKAGDFWECRVGGNIQFSDTLPLMWDKGINGGRISLNRLAEITSSNAARRYGLYPRKGAIAVDSDADLVVVDPEREMTLGVDRYRGISDYSIWEGRKVKGAPVMTFLHGELVMQDGEITAKKPSGRHLVAA